MVERLLITQEPRVRVDPPTSPGRRVRFIARLQSTGDFVALSHQPLVDGARELLKRGWPAQTLLTMRHYDKPCDSFEPKPIGEWAKLTYSESGRLQIIPWEPYTGPPGARPIDKK